jgi:hypothetical protein
MKRIPKLVSRAYVRQKLRVRVRDMTSRSHWGKIGIGPNLSRNGTKTTIALVNAGLTLDTNQAESYRSKKVVAKL